MKWSDADLWSTLRYGLRDEPGFKEIKRIDFDDGTEEGLAVYEAGGRLFRRAFSLDGTLRLTEPEQVREVTSGYAVSNPPTGYDVALAKLRRAGRAVPVHADTRVGDD